MNICNDGMTKGEKRDLTDLNFRKQSVPAFLQVN